MELMNNTYLKFKDIEFDGNLVKDYTDLSVLPSIPAKYYDIKYIKDYTVQDNELIEAISYNIYGNTNYWDIIMAGNNMTSFNDLPVDYDTVLARASYKYYKFLDKPNLTGIPLTQEKKDLVYQEILDEEVLNNEKYRIIKYINPDDISSLVSDLEKLKGTASINFKVLISKDNKD